MSGYAGLVSQPGTPADSSATGTAEKIVSVPVTIGSKNVDHDLYTASTPIAFNANVSGQQRAVMLS